MDYHFAQNEDNKEPQWFLAKFYDEKAKTKPRDLPSYLFPSHLPDFCFRQQCSEGIIIPVLTIKTTDCLL